MKEKIAQTRARLESASRRNRPKLKKAGVEPGVSDRLLIDFINGKLDPVTESAVEEEILMSPEVGKQFDRLTRKLRSTQKHLGRR